MSTPMRTMEIIADGKPAGRVRIGTVGGRPVPAAACRRCRAMAFEDTVADDRAALAWVLEHLREVHGARHVAALMHGTVP